MEKICVHPLDEVYKRALNDFGYQELWDAVKKTNPNGGIDNGRSFEEVIKIHRDLDKLDLFDDPGTGPDLQERIEAKINRFKRIINPFKKPIRILDLGCGKGYFAQTCAQRYGKNVDVHGLDIVRYGEWQTEENLTYHLGHVQGISTYFPQEKFDLIVDTFGIKYAEDQKLVLEQVVDLLSKQGEFMGFINFQDFARKSGITPDQFLEQLYSSGKVAKVESKFNSKDLQSAIEGQETGVSSHMGPSYFNRKVDYAPIYWIHIVKSGKRENRITRFPVQWEDYYAKKLEEFKQKERASSTA